MKIFNKILLTLLYLSTIIILISISITGSEYYLLSDFDRPHNISHDSLKPSGVIGHGIGVVGSLLMILLLSYSVRKRARFLRRAGNIRTWLNYHIWMGVTGPILVIFHTSFKVGGIVAVSFWSMIAVALSGVFGRYIYLQIPRSLNGNELSGRQIEETELNLMGNLRATTGDDSILEKIQEYENDLIIDYPSGWKIIPVWISNDLGLSVKLHQIGKKLSKSTGLPRPRISEIISIMNKRIKIRRRKAFLETANSLLHYWHVIHRPFAVIMLFIMIIHVIVAVLFGYKWIF
ncbi:MAG: hypothetical protein P9L92_15660 [Candidatus Electryonea clarkiae]|nr:hypothetical protein [Candidatus Electryonea clarkiae]MDP8287261.1 hypothetical protein [Candidatus Electryonea clarkiae]